MTRFNSELWSEWVVVCNKYLRKFCEKHGYDFNEATDSWVIDFDGTIVLCGDEYVSMEDIILDIEMNAPEGEFIKWYDYCLDCYENGKTAPNYYFWLNGYNPYLYKKDKIDDDNSKKSSKIETLKAELYELIDEIIETKMGEN